MENELQIFNNQEFGEIRTIEVDGEPWFVGADIARALGYANPYNAITRCVDEEDSLVKGVLSKGGMQQTKIINESGMYALIIMSELPSAKKFKRWITKEVIPVIMKTGSYNIPQLSTNELILKIAQSNVELEREVKELKESQSKIEQKIETAIQVFAKPDKDHWKDDMENAIELLSSTYGLSIIKLRGELYKDLESNGIYLESRLLRLRSRLKKQGVTYKERQAITKLDVISRDKQLRPIFEGIVKKHQAMYAVNME